MKSACVGVVKIIELLYALTASTDCFLHKEWILIIAL